MLTRNLTRLTIILSNRMSLVPGIPVCTSTQTTFLGTVVTVSLNVKAIMAVVEVKTYITIIVKNNIAKTFSATKLPVPTPLDVLIGPVRLST